MPMKLREVSKYSKFIFLFLSGIASVLFSAGQQVLVDKVLAVVGDNIILQSDVEAQYQQMASQSPGQAMPPDSRCMIFDNLLLDKLFLSQAQIDSITVSPDEVDAELDRRVKYFISIFGSKEKLEDYYGKKIIELKEDFRDDIEKQLLSDKMKSKAFSNLKVSPAEVENFFKKIPDDSIPYFNSELELGEIIIYPKVSELEKSIAREKIEKIRDEILAGADFGVKAIQYSEDPGSQMDGGNLGWIERGEMVPEFESVVYRLKEGQVSDVFETPFGFHIALVDEKRGDKLKVRHILIRPRILESDTRLVAERLDSVLHQLQVDSLSWQNAVSKFSEDEQSKGNGGMMTNPKTGNAFFEKPDIDGQLLPVIDKMKVGDFSNVLEYKTVDKTGDNKTGVRIIWLKSETKPHKANLEQDYSKIQMAAKAEKQQRALDAWVREHRPNSYVHIDPSMKGCPQMSKWVD